MKSEKRHELETNYLANWMGQVYKRSESYHKTNFSVLVEVILELAVLAVARRFTGRGSDAAWDRFYAATAAGNHVELERLAEEYPGTTVAHWALAVSADVRLANATMQVFSDKPSAGGELQKAI